MHWRISLVHWGLFSAFGGISLVNWGYIIGIVGVYSALGDIMICRGISSVHWGVQCIEGYHKCIGGYYGLYGGISLVHCECATAILISPQCTDDVPAMH